MLSITVFDHHAEIRIVTPPGFHNTFSTDLQRIKNDIQPQDRKFNPDKKVWVVNNIKAYTHLPYIASALEYRALQKELFPEATC